MNHEGTKDTKRKGRDFFLPVVERKVMNRPRGGVDCGEQVIGGLG
jgi:hypothetical protein